MICGYIKNYTYSDDMVMETRNQINNAISTHKTSKTIINITVVTEYGHQKFFVLPGHF